MNTKQLKNLIREVVLEVYKEEIQEAVSRHVKKMVSIHTPIIVKELCEDIVLKTLSENIGDIAPTLNEDVSYRELTKSDMASYINKHPERKGSINREKILALMDNQPAPNASGLITNVVVDEAGNEHVVPAHAIRPSLQRALTKDYREVIQKVEEKAARLRPMSG